MLPESDVRRNVDRRLRELHDRHKQVALGDDARFYEPGRGYRPFDEIPASHDRFAIALASVIGEVASVGDDESPFALQSISKVFAYGLALEDHGRERVLQRVGVEPSGDAFNSIVFDEQHNRPYNPMVNAGALV
ncbi:MAG: glutaminase, partial [Solirubrobacteraceae bacterium]